MVCAVLFLMTPVRALMAATATAMSGDLQSTHPTVACVGMLLCAACSDQSVGTTSDYLTTQQ